METCTLLTTEANALLVPYHDRMSVILRPEDYEVGLDADVGWPELLITADAPILVRGDERLRGQRPR